MMIKIKSDIVKPLFILSAASLSLALFSALTPPVMTTPVIPGLSQITVLEGDLPVYCSRFFLSTLLLGVFPLAVILVLRYKPAELGLCLPRPFLKPWHTIALIAGALVIGAVSSFSDDLAAYYPYSTTLVSLIGRGSIAWLFLHYAFYFFFYYIPWEFFFRGVLIFPFLKLMDCAAAEKPGGNASSTQPALIAAIVCFQTIPSVMLHFGHPLSELISAIPAGLFFGFLAWKTRSIIPGLVVHALIGLALDTGIILQSLGTAA